jgi:hypothetical protein
LIKAAYTLLSNARASMVAVAAMSNLRFIRTKRSVEVGDPVFNLRRVKARDIESSRNQRKWNLSAWRNCKVPMRFTDHQFDAVAWHIRFASRVGLNFVRRATREQKRQQEKEVEFHRHQPDYGTPDAMRW